MRLWKWRRGFGVTLMLAAACGSRPGPAATRFDAAAEFAKVTAVHARFVAARDRLASLGSHAPDPSPAGDAAARRREAETAYDAAFVRDQLALATFLNQALNLAPDRPETREALALYADAAIANARALLGRGGDVQRALAPLAAAQRAYSVLGIPVPARLAAAVAEAKRPPAPTATPGTAAPASRPRRRRR